jgi:DnaK suppressor protein
MFSTELQTASAPRRLKPNSFSRTRALLTAAQVCAMPDNEYMNPVQLALFTALLSDTELDLVNKAHRADIEIAAGSTGANPVDPASAEEEHRMALSTRGGEESQLLEVRASLGGISTGEFGYCDETGDPIGI